MRVMCSHTAAQTSGAVDAELPVQQTQDEYNAALATAFSEIEEEQKLEPFPYETFFPSYANVVTMTGTLAADPVLRSFNSGSTIATATLRVRRPNTKVVDTCAFLRLHEYPHYPRHWHDALSPACRYMVEVWDDLAHRFKRHLKKGLRVQIHGSLKIDRYKHKETGAPQSMTKIHANSAWIINPATIPPESGAAATPALYCDVIPVD